MIQTILIIVTTSMLSALFTLIGLRWVLLKALEGISGLTHLGAKIAGEASGFRGASKAVAEEAAAGVLTGPQLSGIKMLASQLGFDLDAMIEEHGATETLAGITQLLQMIGIDPMELLNRGVGGLTKHLLGKGHPKTGRLP